MGNVAKRRLTGGVNPTMAMDEMPAALKEKQRLDRLRVQAMTKNWKDAPPLRKKSEGKRKPLIISEAVLQMARDAKREVTNPFKLPAFPSSCTPPKDGPVMAMDDVFGDANTGNDFSWASQSFLAGIGAIYQEGLAFPGYTFLAELAQRPEYRVISEIIAEEMTRKWIKITSKSDDEDKTDKIRELSDTLEKLKIREAFQRCAEIDGFFGRAHLYIDIRTDGSDEGSDTTVIDREELKMPIGNGRDETTKSKVPPGSFKRIKAIEPVWTYPTNYNASDPLSAEWYEPDMWYVMGKQIHKSRLLKFVGREVPDILKPAYAFGGLSMSQMAKPYVDNWLKTRQAVADIISAFSVFVLSMDMGEVLAESSDLLFKRVDLFNLLRNNKGTMVINKDSEEFANVAAPLGTLDSLQAQTQEHMASVARVPIVKLLGIQPAGLNASSEGEIRTFYDHIHAYQEKFFKPNMEIVFNLTQMSLWGEVDDDLVFTFIELWELDAAALATKNKTDADTGNILIQAGVISPAEERKRIANDPDTPYQSLDVNDVPEPPAQEGMEDGGEADGEEGGSGPAEGTPGGGLGEGTGPDRGGEGGNVGGEQQGERGVPRQGNGKAGGLSVVRSENEDVETPRIKQSERNRLTAAAALARQKRRAAADAMGGSFVEGAAHDANPFKTFCTGLSALWHVMALDKDWKEGDHPRDKDGKFAPYGIAPGLKNKAAKLGFSKFSVSDSGKIKLTHANGSVLVVEPPGGKGAQSQIYSFYPADGGKPIKAQLTGQSGKSFFEKVGPLLTQVDLQSEASVNAGAPKVEKLIMGDPEASKDILSKASEIQEKYLSNIDDVESELKHNKTFKEAADDLGLRASDIVKLYKGEVEKHGAPPKSKEKQTAAKIVPSFAGMPGEELVNSALEKGLELVNSSPLVIVLKMPDGTNLRIGAHGTWQVAGQTSGMKGLGNLNAFLNGKLAEQNKPDTGVKPHEQFMTKLLDAGFFTQSGALDNDGNYVFKRKQDNKIFKVNPKSGMWQDVSDGTVGSSVEELDKVLKGGKKSEATEPKVKISDYATFEEYEKAAKSLGEKKMTPAGKEIVKKYYAEKNKAADPAVLEQAKKQSESNNKMFKSLQDKGYKNEVNAKEDSKGILTFKDGDKEFKVAANGDWLASSPGFSAKAGSGHENLEAFLSGEKAFGTKWNKGDLSSWAAEHDPEKAKELEEKKQKQAAEQAAQQAESKKSQAEANASMKKVSENLSKWKGPTPTATQKSAISHYTGSGYGSMNGALRGGSPLSGQSKELQDYLMTCSFPEDGVVYRGIKGEYAKHIKSALVKGSIFQDKGFSSTSAKSDMGFNSEGTEMRMKIHVKKGAKGAAVHHISSHGMGEAEAIFAAGTRFRVLSIPKDTKSGSSQWIEVEMLLPEEHED